MTCFSPADILLPKETDMEKWAVIACDQFTSEPAYWQRVEEQVGGAPSALRLIFPEAELKQEPEERIASIHAAMEAYVRRELFCCTENCFVYVERRLSDGTLRRGLVGKLDLECYEYSVGTDAPVRATERTVLERIPPRVKIREGALLELPHVLLLCDDAEDLILSPLAGRTEAPTYDFELMEGGGHIRGWLIRGEEAAAVCERLARYEQAQRERCADWTDAPMLYAVGDGNHSLASAKACYEKLRAETGAENVRDHPARYALVELENLEDPAQRFEPIHRVIRHTDVAALLAALEAEIGADEGTALPWFSGEKKGRLVMRREPGRLAVGTLQSFLDRWLEKNHGEIDYIHGEDSLLALSREEDSVGFLLPDVEKDAFFRSIMTEGVLPRKTFSMGHARDKRYYIEARRIR